MKIKTITIRHIAEQLARELMEEGDGTTPCHRIEFKGGQYPDAETSQGGLCESAVATWLEDRLKRYIE